ncbi:MAG: NAD(+)/NADH kinase [Planctomycetia bacterium]|nr:NAD(+)/NADH kinase [Planctomycetia bacterium]
MNERDPQPNDATPTERKRPRVFVLGAGKKASIAAGAERLREVVERHTEVVLWDLAFQADLSKIEAEWAIVFGGDGSILRAAYQMGYRQFPMLGVNLGKLGFLADLAPNDLPATLPRLCSGEFRVGKHLMFECTLFRDDREVWTELGLNETAVVAGPPFVIVDIHLYVDAEMVTTYSCDGLIVSTPVGSTAHSLSAGGPILRKDLSAFVISPISPHTLTMRPVVDSADRTYELIVPEPNSEMHVVIDGRDKGLLEPGDRLRIRRAEPCCLLIEPPGNSYYRTLREKLGWGGRFLPSSG